MTVKTRNALSLTVGSSATCMAAFAHHFGEKAIPYGGIGFCESDSAIVESRIEFFTDSSNRTSHPFGRNEEPPALAMQLLACLAKNEMSGPRCSHAGNECEAVGAPRTYAPATDAEGFSGMDLHAHPMATIADFPFSMLFVY